MKRAYLNGKFTLLIFVTVICFVVLGTGVFAANFSDVPTNANYADAVNVLVDDGILTGDENGNFNPNNTITRAEFATIICRFLGIEDEAKAMNTSKFTDVTAGHWAKGYIAKASDMGVITGNGDGTFSPEDNVTYEQAVKMLICAVGFEEEATEAGGWPDGYIKVAEDFGYLKDLNKNIGQQITRAEVAVLLANYIKEQGGNDL